MYLGIDLGTSGLKALLVDGDQATVAETTAPLTVQRPHPGWSEQDPGAWIQAARTAIAGLKDKADLSGVKAVGLSGQMHGAVMLGPDDTPLRPAILWNDTRSHEEAATLDAAEGMRETSGNIVFPSFTAPKLLWTKHHEPETFAKVASVLLPKDYLRLWLTGEKVSEPSDASGTSWLDVKARTWSDALLAHTHMSAAQMPRLVEGSEVSGTLRADLAGELGLPAGVPVAGGAGDNAGSAIGMGIVSPGSAFLSLGTSGVLFAGSDGFRPAPETSVHAFAHALPDTWHQMGVILAATDALNWLAGVLGEDASALTQNLGPAKAPGRALFLPYLGGERTPHNDASVRGAFLGLAHEADRDAMVRAVLEGVAFAVTDCRDALAQTGTALSDVIAVGGGSRSAAWLDIMACALDLAIKVPAAGDYGAAFGAARLAMMADGAGTDILSAPATERTIEPRADLNDAFAEGHARYRKAYEAIRAF